MLVIKYIFISFLIIVFMNWGVELGYSVNSPFYTHLTYSFQHVNLFHLIINSIAFINVFGLMEGFVNRFKLLLVSYSIAFVASFPTMQTVPTVGASAMIYSMIGMMSVIVVFNGSTMRQKTTFFLSIAIMLSVSIFNSSSNFAVHIYSYLLGSAYYFTSHKKRGGN